MDVALARAWVAAIAEAVDERADELTRLDSAIGDGDHGVNLRRGFSAAVAALDGYEAATVGDVLVRTGTTLVSKVGGAAGPLYGSAFRAMGKALAGPTADTAALAGALRAGLDAMRKLGGAAPGDKTIIDAFAPAVAAFTGTESMAARSAAAAAEAGMRATIPLPARKGRASYLGERSIGHQDPGATSTWLIFDALARVTAPSTDPDPGR